MKNVMHRLMSYPVAAALVAIGVAAARESESPASAGGEAWWIQQTALQRDGTIMPLSGRPWWKQALALRIGESFVIPASGEAKGRMLVRREKLVAPTANGEEAFVWIIDDDGDGSASRGGDRDEDCYVVDYRCDGSVDRMVDYIDNDGDRDMDEIDIRYFTNGRLDWAWFGEDVDDDGIVRNVVNYERGDEFRGDPYGDNLFYMNKYNPEKGLWSPISECPFAFYDTDGDGFSETVVRFSVAPADRNTSVPDYANSSFRAPWEPAMENPSVVNIRYSFDVDRGSCGATPLHYDMGFNLLGSMPYRFPAMARDNAKRRPPRRTIVVPWKDVRAVADIWRAEETGFSWNENVDDTVVNGSAPNDPYDYRWEGVFWVWERRFMPNTGGPCQKWNMRREWSGKPSQRRELYYSGVDQRIHLVGAEEGWIEIGHFGGMGAIGEVRMYDTDRNGFFDRWEVYLDGSERPARVTTVGDERARRIDSSPDAVTALYVDDVLPNAIAGRRKLMRAMSAWRAYQVPDGLRRAMETGPASYRRYAMDIVCELQYQDFRSALMSQANEVLRRDLNTPRSPFMGDLIHSRQPSAKVKGGGKDSQDAWRLIRVLSELDAAYGCGDTERACAAIEAIQRIGLFR